MMEIISIVGSWLICAVAAERSAEALTTSVFFSPLRQFLARASLTESNNVIFKITRFIAKWLSDLVSCGWCTSLWTSLFFSFFLPGDYLLIGAGNNILVKIIALWGFANLYHSVFRLVHNGRVSAVDINLKIVGQEIDSIGENYGEFGQSTEQDNTSGAESSAI